MTLILGVIFYFLIWIFLNLLFVGSYAAMKLVCEDKKYPYVILGVTFLLVNIVFIYNIPLEIGIKI